MAVKGKLSFFCRIHLMYAFWWQNLLHILWTFFQQLKMIYIGILPTSHTKPCSKRLDSYKPDPVLKRSFLRKKMLLVVDISNFQNNLVMFFFFFFYQIGWSFLSIDSDFMLCFIVRFIPMWFFTLQNRNSSALCSAHCRICSWPCFLVWCFVSREQVSSKKSNIILSVSCLFCMEIKKWKLTCG